MCLYVLRAAMDFVFQKIFLIILAILSITVDPSNVIHNLEKSHDGLIFQSLLEHQKGLNCFAGSGFDIKVSLWLLES